ncbi:glycine betaine ABC transporter substrate-binding protein [Pseudodesulfovibrio sp.]|uniref:glycine betaine ABC transporter substrate-binding protein n=1 Tax=unclassified Pseudodesulfovibrio TaxID=2661612 RepID=UPI003AFFC1F4
MRTLIISLLLTLMATCPAFAGGTITIAHADWSSSIASATLLQAVLQAKTGRTVNLVQTDAEGMWRMVAEGKADTMLSAWLPDTHDTYFAKYHNELKDLGPNLEGTRIGIVVPNMTEGRYTAGTGLRNRPYLTTRSIPELADNAAKYKHRIVGIEPGAGIMLKTQQAIKAYGLDKTFRLVPGDEQTMVDELADALGHQRWVAVTGWMPHWCFAQWDLKFLDDPKKIFGQTGHINTMVRKGLEKDDPEAYAVLDKFHWSLDEINLLMLWMQTDGGRFPYEKALRWMRTHPKRVQSWLP